MEDIRREVQGIIDEIARQEAKFCKERGRNGGAIVVLFNLAQKSGIERQRALARTIIRGTTPQVRLVRFFREALDQATSYRNEYIAMTRVGFFYIGVAGLSPFRSHIVATRILLGIRTSASRTP